MSPAPDVVRAVRETYDLEVLLSNGLAADALDKAITAGLEAHTRAVHLQMATRCEQIAADMEASDDQDNPDFATALRWWAHKIRTEYAFAPEPYQPNDDDVVEITITGPVMEWVGDPKNKPGDYDFSVLDDATGHEYFFETRRPPRVRVLKRNDDNQGEQ